MTKIKKTYRLDESALTKLETIQYEYEQLSGVKLSQATMIEMAIHQWFQISRSESIHAYLDSKDKKQ